MPMEINWGAATDHLGHLRALVQGALGGRFASTKLVSTKFRGELQNYYLAAVASASNTAVHANITCPTSGTTVVTSAITNPDVPRVLRVKGNQSTVTGNVVIVGTDINNNACTDTIASNGTSTVAGTHAFKTVTSITVPVRGAASDAISIGYEDIIGLPDVMVTAKIVSYWVNAVQQAVAPTATASGTDVSLNTLTLATAGAGHVVEVLFIAEQNTAI